MRELFFKIPGKPVGKARPRWANGHMFTPSRTREYEEEVKKCYVEAGGEKAEGNAPIQISVHCFFKPPKSASKAKKKMMLDWDIVPTVKPDIDNVLKIVMDGLNGVAYEDDKQVISCSCYKAYKDEECVEVIVTRGENNDTNNQD